MKIEIKNQSDVVLFSHDAIGNNLRITLEKAVSKRLDLSRAFLKEGDLQGSRLRRANLCEANLSSAYLNDSDLREINLSKSDIRWAKLYGSDLRKADLREADMRWVSLQGADLRWSDMRGVNLHETNLHGTDMRGCNLDGEILNKTPTLVPGFSWPIIISGQYMRIGCERYTHAEWKAFTDNNIPDMASDVWDFWKKWKYQLLLMCNKQSEAKNQTKPGRSKQGGARMCAPQP